jgi:hypothetical protein
VDIEQAGPAALEILRLAETLCEWPELTKFGNVSEPLGRIIHIVNSNAEDVMTRATDLHRDLKVTSGCRFISANRLRRRNGRMALIIALASVLVIALTVLPLVYKLPPAVSGDLVVATLVMSLLILAFSLLDYSNNDSAVAEQHHRCGLEVRELRRLLRNKPEPVSDTDLDAITEAYGQTLQKYSINHDDDDFKRYQLDHPDEFPLSKWQTFKFTVALLFSGKAAYVLMMTVMATVFLWLVFWHVLPARIAEPITPAPHSN